MAELIINGKSYNLDFRFKNFIKYRELFNSDFFTDIEYLFQKNLNFIRELPSEIQDKILNKSEQNNIQFNDLIKIQNANSFDLSLSDNEIYEIIKDSGFNGAKLEGIVNWVSNSIKSLLDLQQQIIQTNDFDGMSGIQ